MSLYGSFGERVVQLVQGATPPAYAKIGADLVRLVDLDGNDVSFGGSQTPWLSNIDAGAFNLTNVALIKGPTADAFLSIGNGAQVVLYNNNNLGTGIDDTGLVSKHGTVYLDAAVAIDAVSVPIINVSDPTNPQDAATKKYVDDNAGGSQTPWTSDIDMANYRLTDIGGAQYFSLNDIGVDGAIRLSDTSSVGIALDSTLGTSVNGGPFSINAIGGSGIVNFTIQGDNEQTMRFYNSASVGTSRVSWKMADVNNSDWTWIWFTDFDESGGSHDLTLLNHVLGTGFPLLNARDSGQVSIGAIIDDGTSAAFQVNGDASVSGAYWAGGLQGATGVMLDGSIVTGGLITTIAT